MATTIVVSVGQYLQYLPPLGKDYIEALRRTYKSLSPVRSLDHVRLAHFACNGLFIVSTMKPQNTVFPSRLINISVYT